MTDQATRVVPAGWYQDPAIQEQVRWWNGLAWTEHVREKPSATATPESGASGRPIVVTANATSSVTRTTDTSPHDTTRTATPTSTPTDTAKQITAARDLERRFGVGTSENEIITGATALGFGTAVPDAQRAELDGPDRAARLTPLTAATRQPAGPPRTKTASAAPTTTRTATGSAWLIALTPLVMLLIGIAAAYIFFYVASAPVVFVVAILLPYLLGLLWAIGDGHTLKARGFAPPRALWALLGAAGYLIVRRLRVPGFGPLVMFLVVGVLTIAVPAVAYGSGALRPLSTALTIQNTIANDYVNSGRAVSVTCPPFVDATTTGRLYTCTSTLASGVTRTIWVSIDGNDGEFSYALAI